MKIARSIICVEKMRTHWGLLNFFERKKALFFEVTNFGLHAVTKAERIHRCGSDVPLAYSIMCSSPADFVFGS